MARTGEELVNPVTGERIVFRKTAAETDGTLLEMDDYWTQLGHRAPEHVHPEMQESWKIIVGAACFRIDGVERTAGPGEVIVAEAGVPHQAWNPTAEPVHLRIQMRPALDWETFIERLLAVGSGGDDGKRRALDSELMLDLLREFPREISLAPSSGS